MAACVTALKRTHDLENYGQPYELSPKRQRCSSRNSYSPKSNSLNIESLSLSGANGGRSSPKHSEFPVLDHIPKDEILKQVTSEARNLKRRRELPSQKAITQKRTPFPEKTTTSSSDSDSDSVNTKFYKKIAKEVAYSKTNRSLAQTNPASPSGLTRCKSPESKKISFSNPDTELRLTLRNVAMICETLLRQREDSIREEYDKVLHEKLQEQYEIWCRYNQDQLQQHKPSSSSNYIS